MKKRTAVAAAVGLACSACASAPAPQPCVVVEPTPPAPAQSYYMSPTIVPIYAADCVDCGMVFLPEEDSKQ